MLFQPRKRKTKSKILVQTVIAVAAIAVVLFALDFTVVPKPAQAASSADTSAHVTVKSLYAFTGGSDGGFPDASLLRDGLGNLYGTTSNGGNSACGLPHLQGCGVVFEVTPSGQETVLHAFSGLDGNLPVSSLVMDAMGNLYGTTEYGGNLSDCSGYGCGVVFMLSPPETIGQPWIETVLHSFGSFSDGQNPIAGLTVDGQGDAYGTTFYGGLYGQGILFKMDSSGAESILYNFCQFLDTFGNCSDGGQPTAPPILGSAGYLYGTTTQGGIPDGQDYSSGTVYSFSAAGKESVLHSFQGAPDGGYPASALVQDSQSSVYGTTQVGGTGVCARFSCGTAYQVSPQGQETVLHSFQGGSDGGNPIAGLVRLPAGALFGTTAIGGSGSCSSANGGTGCGTIFEIQPNGKEQVIYSFQGGSQGAFPQAALITDGKGHAYGTTSGSYFGGDSGYGTVFEISQ